LTGVGWDSFFCGERRQREAARYHDHERRGNQHFLVHSL
jgi:hypothetical protein